MRHARRCPQPASVVRLTLIRGAPDVAVSCASCGCTELRPIDRAPPPGTDRHAHTPTAKEGPTP